MSLKHIPLFVCAVALLVFSTSAGAQFTAAVVPPRVKAKADTTLKQDSVRRATVALAARVTDMKKWVDSAAGVSIPAVDSTRLQRAGDSSKTAVLKDSVILNRNARIRADSAASIGTVEVHDSTGLKAPADSVPAKKKVPQTSMREMPLRDDSSRFAIGARSAASV